MFTSDKMLLQQPSQLLDFGQNLFCHLFSNPFIFPEINDSLHIGQTLKKKLAPGLILLLLCSAALLQRLQGCHFSQELAQWELSLLISVGQVVDNQVPKFWKLVFLHKYPKVPSSSFWQVSTNLSLEWHPPYACIPVSCLAQVQTVTIAYA